MNIVHPQNICIHIHSFKLIHTWALCEVMKFVLECQHLERLKNTATVHHGKTTTQILGMIKANHCLQWLIGKENAYYFQ